MSKLGVENPSLPYNPIKFEGGSVIEVRAIVSTLQSIVRYAVIGIVSDIKIHVFAYVTTQAGACVVKLVSCLIIFPVNLRRGMGIIEAGIEVQVTFNKKNRQGIGD